jgi:hypothetical protein
LQAVIEQVHSNEEREIILESVKDILLDLTQDLYGTHIIEKIIVCFSEDTIQFIYNFIIENFMLLANHSNGLCVVKKIIIHSIRQETIFRILKEITDNALYLVQNPYGNYAIQVSFEVSYIFKR